ncbi:MAG: tRNA (adenosine(37)-N6)-threonylcarbamoyltransferase complex transferase subunit TsaD, partial [Synergistaceae bacterium]|nr:tRNA (adenosine(37)-N6)-threonylcarbamoyltransferase complex transferase subunit TsaD [Synergistaceae bacterium]
AQGDDKAFDFPVPLKNTHEIEFSFSGLKTALLWRVKKLQADNTELDNKIMCDLCASFQRAVTEALVAKVKLAVKLTGIKNIAVSGGVAANSALRSALKNLRGVKAYLPRFSRCTDNAVMIAMAGKNNFDRAQSLSNTFSPDPALSI